jgi:hypothetical protein
MGLLDNEPTPRYTPPTGRKYRNQTVLSQEARDAKLNNFDREPVTEDFSDSPFADRND